MTHCQATQLEIKAADLFLQLQDQPSRALREYSGWSSGMPAHQNAIELYVKTDPCRVMGC